MSTANHYTSAADAYSTTPTQHGQSGNDSPFDYPMRASVDQPSSHPASNLPIAGSGIYGSSTTNAYGYARAPNHDDDVDDDGDEDWNVYDDFNMTRPVPHRRSTSGLASQNDAYWDASKPSLVGRPYMDVAGNRKSLLPSEAFGFDVRNADPRRSIIQPNSVANRNSHYSNTLSGMGPQHADSTTGIELITVPALGNEYTKEELRGMTRGSKRRRKRSQRRKRCQVWVSGQDHICGWLSPRLAVLVMFFILVSLGVMLYFVIPRVPTFAILSTNPVTAIPNGASMKVNRAPTNFSMDMGFNLRADNRASWIPTHAQHLEMEVSDLNTYKLVGKASMDAITFKARSSTVFQFAVHFSYASVNVSGDETWQGFYTACGPSYPGQSRPSLNLAVKLTMRIRGLIGSKQTYTQLGGVACPFTLQTYQ